MFRLPRFLQRSRSAPADPAAAAAAPLAVSAAAATEPPVTYEGAQSLLAEGRAQEARLQLERLVAIEPGHARALNLLGVIAHRAGDAVAAVGLLERAVRADAGLAGAQYNLGNALAELGRFEPALQAFEVAVRLEPGHADALCNRGLVLQQLQRHEAAAASFEQALALRPDDADLHASLAEVRVAMGQAARAIRHFERAIEIRPQPAIFHHAHAVALAGLGKYEEALAAYDRTLALQPDSFEALSNRGNALSALGRLEEAVDSHDRALALRPDLALLHLNRGQVLHELGRIQEASASHDRAIALSPDNAGAHFNRSLQSLLHGDFAAGWAGYEWRWKNTEMVIAPRRYSQPLWLGQAPLAGRTILLHAEQGLGDTLQFCRYVPMVAALGARVILEVQGALLDLLRGLPGVEQLLSQGQAVPPVDWQCPLMSLPLALKTTLDNIPTAEGCLRADPQRVARWRARLGPSDGPLVGLVWSGSLIHRADRRRSLQLSQLVAHLPAGPRYVSLQKEVREADRPVLAASPQILDVSASLADFSDTAALCECLDLVVSVDTSVAHLAGTLARPVWVLLPRVPDFRWLLEREDSPWYPTARLYRQGPEGQWAPVLTRLGADLAALRRS